MEIMVKPAKAAKQVNTRNSRPCTILLISLNKHRGQPKLSSE
jgi:hypothetical protein